MSDVMVLRKITQFDIEEGRSFLKKAGTFRGSSVLDNPYLTDICIRLTGTDDDKRSTLQDISDWLREQEKNGDVKCYVSTVTLG
jgi:hypothetical protein